MPEVAMGANEVAGLLASGCSCPECRLKFHREMARWAREQVQAEQRAPRTPRCKSKGSKGKQSKGIKGKRSKRVKVPKGKKGKKKERYPRGWMPWTNVIKLISDSTLLEPEDVRLVLQQVKEVGVAELRAGRSFNFKGLAKFKLDTQPRVTATVAEGRAWGSVSVYGWDKDKESDGGISSLSSESGDEKDCSESGISNMVA